MRAQVPRRAFLQSAAGAAAAPYFFSTSSSLADESTSPNSRFRMGVIGAGGIANANLKVAKKYADVVAVCDVDKRHANAFNNTFSKGRADVYVDYQDLLARDDLDAVMIATPDHWHAKVLIETMRSGVAAYCEKPLTLTIEEGKRVCEVQRETGAVVQVGTQQRSTFKLFTTAIAIVQSGRLGKIKRLEAVIGGAPSCDPIPVASTPKSLDWNRWLGPAPFAEYRFAERKGKRPNTNCHYEFRWWYDYSGGKLTDWGAHHVDICAWALEANGQSPEPTRISGAAEHPVEFVNGKPTRDDCYNTASKFDFLVELPGGAEMHIRSDGRNGVLIEGEEGRIFVSRGSLKGKPVEDLENNPLPEDALAKAYKNAPMELNERAAHWANFFRCVRDRSEPISDVHSHMRGLNTCHLAGIAARLGRAVEWNTERGQIVGDELANSMLGRPYREGFEAHA